MEKLDLTTPNITDENVQKIAELFPNCVTEADNGKTQVVDFDLLKQELSDNIVEGNKERYQLTWPGKAESLVTANMPINKTLRPNREESKDFDNTENLYIEGDNLEVLKLLQETYLGKVKIIYIDPPYNTGKDFVYKDNFTQDKAEYDAESGNVDEEGGRLVSNYDSNGRYHSDWLSMMYPRLKLARNLLKDDGVIFISIDDNEEHNIRKICNEIFGEKNVDMLIWNKEAEGKSGTLKQTSRFRSIHEYVVICYKNKSMVYFDKISEPLKGRENEFQTANLAVNEQQQNNTHDNFYQITSPNGIVWEKHWKVSRAEFDNLNADELIYWGNRGDSQPRRILPTDHRRMVYSTSIIEKGGTTIGRKDYEMVMPEGTFSYPKPISLIGQMITISKSKNETVLDFFGGSSSTAHAIMQVNSIDNGNRKFILVQIPETTDEKSEAYKAGYKNIAEIGKERIRRAGEKIKEDNADKDGIDELDIGFRVLKVDSSNMKDVYFTPDNTQQSNLFDLASNIKDGRTDEDLLFMVLLDWGIDLSVKIERREVAGKTVYFADDDYLAACFEDNLDEDFVKALVKERPRKVVLRDSGFASSSVKINVGQILNQSSIEIKVI